MSNLASRLDEITRFYWQLWHDWRYSQGWRLGPDNQAAKLSPYLVSNWDQLGEEGRVWFRQHAALVLASINQLPAAVVVDEVETTGVLMRKALQAMKNGRVQEALDLVEKSGAFPELLDTLRKVRGAKLPEHVAMSALKQAVKLTE